ncbi:MAG: hypothetical protein QM756_16935 [Polyangiaceae bacterium]
MPSDSTSAATPSQVTKPGMRGEVVPLAKHSVVAKMPGGPATSTSEPCSTGNSFEGNSVTPIIPSIAPTPST